MTYSSGKRHQATSIVSNCRLTCDQEARRSAGVGGPDQCEFIIVSNRGNSARRIDHNGRLITSLDSHDTVCGTTVARAECQRTTSAAS
jgi:hypothetical protein